MKQLIVTICLATSVIFFLGCEKDNAKVDMEYSNAILGTWELRHTSSAWFPTGTAHPAGNGDSIKFTNSNYEKYKGGQLVKSGTYSVIFDTTVEESVCLVLPDNQFTRRIIYDNDYTAAKEFVNISGKNLSIISGCYAVDAGHTSVYEKQ